ncbi:MAG: squalene synthase HpnC [Ignavibacteriales bacterium]|nr:squalene synthase HpnC [Ignavibacteriales bacterium]
MKKPEESKYSIDSTKNYTLEESFDYCSVITGTHYENFPVASFFLPHEKRQYIQAIYAFSRVADDYADEGERTSDERLALLENWERQLQQCYEGEASHPIFIALKDTVKRLDIPIEPLRDLLTAFKRDVVQNRYETFDDLLSYCKCSANPVGRLVLIIFNYRDEKLFELSDHICTALQLANFWQDVKIDKEKNRLYIPCEDMKRHNYALDKWNNRVIDDRFKELMKFEVERTREMFYLGAELPALVTRDLQLELKLIWFGGMAILKKIEKQKYDVWNKRPKLRMKDLFLILTRGLIYNDLTFYKKKKPKKEQWDLT